MNISYPQLLVSLFTTSFVNKIIEGNHHSYLSGVLKQTGFIRQIRKNSSVEKVLSKAFEFLNDHHRCEYVFKTAIVNDLLLGRHSFLDTVYLTELRSYNSKADVVILNGTSTVYEIKSDVDTLARTPSQVSSYQKLFEYVYVVCNAKNAERLDGLVPNSVGILKLGDDLSIQTIRDATSNLEVLDPAIMFDSLRKAEYVEIIREITGKAPDYPGTTIHSNCKRIFSRLHNHEAHQFFLKALKSRQLSGAQIRLINNLDMSIKSLFTEKYYSEKQCKSIQYGLTQKLCNT